MGRLLSNKDSGVENNFFWFYWMIQDKPTFWNTIFLTKGLMKSSIILLSNEEPIISPQLMQIILTASGCLSTRKLLNYHRDDSSVVF